MLLQVQEEFLSIFIEDHFQHSERKYMGFSAQYSDAAAVAPLPVGLTSLRVEPWQLIRCRLTNLSGFQLRKIFA